MSRLLLAVECSSEALSGCGKSIASLHRDVWNLRLNQGHSVFVGRAELLQIAGGKPSRVLSDQVEIKGSLDDYELKAVQVLERLQQLFIDVLF